MQNINIKSKARKKIAQMKLKLLRADKQEKSVILKEIAKQRAILAEVTTTDKDTVYKSETICIPTYGDLLNFLESSSSFTWSIFTAGPTITKYKKWALVAAVNEYYKNLKRKTLETIIDDSNPNKLAAPFSPNSEKIYSLWVNILSKNLNAIKNIIPKNQIENELNGIYSEGFGRGTSFEKQIERYREEFVSCLRDKMKG